MKHRPSWRTVVIALVLTGLAVNVYVQAGSLAFWSIVLAGGGAWLVAAFVMGVSGYSVVHHGKQAQRAIEASSQRRAVGPRQGGAR